MRSNREILLEVRPDVGDLPRARLSSLLTEAPELAQELLEGPSAARPDADLVFATVSAITARALLEHDSALLEESLDALEGMWRLGDRDAMLPVRTPDFEASLWESIVARLYALGGLALLSARWRELVMLVRRDPSDRGSWLRQGQVASSRTAEPEDSLIELAARRLTGLEPSVSDEAAIAAICRFDLCSGLVIGQEDPQRYFPNAAQVGEDAIESFVVQQLRSSESPVRREIFPNDDEGLRRALRDYDEKARLFAAQARYRGSGWSWSGFQDARTLTFIASGQMLEDWIVSGWTGTPRDDDDGQDLPR